MLCRIQNPLEMDERLEVTKSICHQIVFSSSYKSTKEH